MPDIDVNVQPLTRGGVAAAYLDSTTTPPLTTTDDFKVNNDQKTFLHVKNGGTDVTLTIETTPTIDGIALADREVTVSANTEEFIGPFPADVYNDGNHNLSFTLDDVTNVEIAALRV